MSKKVLIISYYWPPAGGVSVHRALKWAKYLPEFGWEPIVYTPKNAEYPFFDEEYIKKVPQNIQVIKYPIREVQSLFKKLSGRKKEHALVSPFQVRNKKSKFFDAFAIWIRSNFFIPDARMLWIKPSVEYLLDFLKNNKVDAIISTGPPHTSNWIGYKLHKTTGIPWISDFQDPWTQADYYKMLNLLPFSAKQHRRMELKILKEASAITTVSPSWAKDLEDIGAAKVTPLYFGFDRDDFLEFQTSTETTFNIIHAGMLGFDRLPENLFKVLSDLLKENNEFGSLLKIKLAGMVDYTVSESIEKHNLTPNTDYLGNIPLTDAYKLAFSSSLPLLLLNKAHNAKGRVPGKLFEYLVTGKPILCLGPLDSDVAQIISKAKAGVTFTYDNEMELKEFVKKAFEDFRLKKKEPDTKNIEDLSVKSQTRQLARILSKISDN